MHGIVNSIKITVCSVHTAHVAESCLNSPFFKCIYFNSTIHSFIYRVQCIVIVLCSGIGLRTFAFRSEFPFKIITCAIVIDAKEKWYEFISIFTYFCGIWFPCVCVPWQCAMWVLLLVEHIWWTTNEPHSLKIKHTKTKSLRKLLISLSILRASSLCCSQIVCNHFSLL